MRLFLVTVFLASSLSCSQSDNPKLFFDKGQYEKAYALWQPLANKWFEKAALGGFSDAQYNLGIMYENGEYIKQDFIIASMWFYVASKNGSSNAKKRIEGLLNDDKLFPNQYNHAKNLAKKYLNIEN